MDPAWLLMKLPNAYGAELPGGRDQRHGEGGKGAGTFEIQGECSHRFNIPCVKSVGTLGAKLANWKTHAWQKVLHRLPELKRPKVAWGGISARLIASKALNTP
eukprot:1157896-Pelagomonas_calceolata.AAC.17